MTFDFQVGRIIQARSFVILAQRSIPRTFSCDVTVVDLQARQSVKDEKGERGGENKDLVDEGSDSEASESTIDLDGAEDDEEEEQAEKPWETLTGAKAKAKVKLIRDRHWAATEIFYANLAAATERLETTKAQEKG